MSERRGSPEPGLTLLAAYDAALPEVYGYLLARCGDRATAEELTSETFLAAVARLRAADPPSPETAWLIGIARHKLVDHWRRRGREQRTREAVAAVARSTHDPTAGAVDAVRARDVLGTLAADQREALVLRHVDGLPVGEVAHALGRTVAATETVLSRARAAFRARFDPERPAGADRHTGADRPTGAHRGGAQ